MRKFRQTLAVVVFATAGHVAVAQLSLSIQMNKPQEPVIGLPYSADQSVRIERHLDNGMTLTTEIKGKVYRSAAGVERCEGVIPSTDPAHPGSTTMVYIVDLAKHTATLLNSKLMTAVIEPLPATATVSVKFLPLQEARFGNRVARPENFVTTDLGKKSDGMMVLVGRRVTGTIAAGKIGNAQPISVVGEVWVDPELKLVVDEDEQNPLTGERTFALSDIRADEPAPALFEIPQGYTVKTRSLVPGGMPPFAMRQGSMPPGPEDEPIKGR